MSMGNFKAPAFPKRGRRVTKQQSGFGYFGKPQAPSPSTAKYRNVKATVRSGLHSRNVKRQPQRFGECFARASFKKAARYLSAFADEVLSRSQAPPVSQWPCLVIDGRDVRAFAQLHVAGAFNYTLHHLRCDKVGATLVQFGRSLPSRIDDSSEKKVVGRALSSSRRRRRSPVSTPSNENRALPPTILLMVEDPESSEAITLGNALAKRYNSVTMVTGAGGASRFMNLFPQFLEHRGPQLQQTPLQQQQQQQRQQQQQQQRQQQQEQLQNTIHERLGVAQQPPVYEQQQQQPVFIQPQSQQYPVQQVGLAQEQQPQYAGSQYYHPSVQEQRSFVPHQQRVVPVSGNGPSVPQLPVPEQGLDATSPRELDTPRVGYYAKGSRLGSARTNRSSNMSQILGSSSPQQLGYPEDRFCPRSEQPDSMRVSPSARRPHVTVQSRSPQQPLRAPQQQQQQQQQPQQQPQQMGGFMGGRPSQPMSTLQRNYSHHVNRSLHLRS